MMHDAKMQNAECRMQNAECTNKMQLPSQAAASKQNSNSGKKEHGKKISITLKLLKLLSFNFYLTF